MPFLELNSFSFVTILQFLLEKELLSEDSSFSTLLLLSFIIICSNDSKALFKLLNKLIKLFWYNSSYNINFFLSLSTFDLVFKVLSYDGSV